MSNNVAILESSPDLIFKLSLFGQQKTRTFFSPGVLEFPKVIILLS
jgi:hypothetical protein